MKITPRRLFENQCTGLFISPDAVIGVTSLHLFSRQNVVATASFFEQDGDAASGLNDFHLDAIKKILGTSGKTEEPADGAIQVAFDDRYVRFFVLPVADKPDKAGVVRLLRWHADKVLPASDDYEFSARLIKGRDGYKVIGAGISQAMIGTLDEVFGHFDCPWNVADSASGFAWNHLDEEVKRNAAALLRFGKLGWTLMAWEDGGDIAFIKTAHWKMDAEGQSAIREGVTEAARLLAIYADKSHSTAFSKVYVEPGYFEFDAEQYAEVFPAENVKILKRTAVPRNIVMPGSDYVAEYTSAYEASMPR
jgi:hypothetical protein